MKVTIIHNHAVMNEGRTRRLDHNNPQGKPCGVFFDFCRDCVATSEYSYEMEGFFAETEATLGLIWRANNRVDGSDVEVLPEDQRSLSVGDVILLTEGASAHAWKIDMVGFSQVDMADVIRALSNADHLDPYWQVA